MTVRLDDVATLTYLARRLRKETYGCAQWDEAGTYSVIRGFVGHGYAETLHLVVGHSMDPKAQTPGAMKRPFVPKRDDGGLRQPAKAGEDCKRHKGEYVGSCRLCAVEQLEHPQDPVLDDDDRTAGQRLRDELRARRLGAQAAAPVVPVDDRPETACAADGCFRPTRDGICDRCRETTAAEDIDTANAELIDRLRANERERAHTRPPADPEPPRHFTGADINHDRVRAAMARRTEGASA